MEIKQAIQIAIPIFVEHKKSDWEVLEESLKNSEIPLSIAEKLLEFMPIAFGRVFMNDLNIAFESNYVRYIVENGKTVEKQKRKLVSEAVFTESYKIAKEMFSKGVGKEEFQAIGFRSAEFSIVNEMMLKGSKPENLVLTPPYLQWRNEFENELQDSQNLESTKNWWQFWK